MRPLKTMIGLGLLAASAPALMASTVAYWRFEEGPAGANVPHGGAGNGVFYAGTMDSSGNGNNLSVFAEGWAGYAYNADTPAPTVPVSSAANNFSVVNTGGYPALGTQTGTALQTWSPSAWTIEAAFQPENGGFRTIVGRDSRGTATSNGDLAALYFQIMPGNELAIKYCDVAGYWHEAISATGTISGYAWPNSASGNWYAAAAVCTGNMLSLYLRNIEANGAGAYTLVAQTDLTTSGSAQHRA